MDGTKSEGGDFNAVTNLHGFSETFSQNEKCGFNVVSSQIGHVDFNAVTGQNEACGF